MVMFEAWDDLLSAWFPISGILQVRGEDGVHKYGAIWLDKPMTHCEKVRISDGVHSAELTREIVRII